MNDAEQVTHDMQNPHDRMTDIQTENTILAWHFLPEDGRLYGDGNLPDDGRTLVKVGQTLIIDPPIELCKRGLHASVKPLDALDYAPGPICCRVRMHGQIKEGGDKLVATHRTVLAMQDVSDLLHLFACDIAEEALERYDDDPDERSVRAIEVKRSWVAGEATDEELEAARDAAWDAAWYVARGTARDAAWHAGRDAAWAAAGYAGRDAANQHLEGRLLDALGEAAHA